MTSTDAKPEVLFAKVVATPTPTGWSQAYSAGSLFAVLSLGTTEEVNLSLLGKEVIDTLEQEYFTLETKNLSSIKQAVSVTLEKIPESVASCFVVAALLQNILYIFVKGKGKVFLRRGETLGTIINGQDNDLTSASGKLNNGDIAILTTQMFSKIVTRDALLSSFDHNTPSDIAEIISPLVHQEEQGEATAIILAYKEQVPEDNRSENAFPMEEKKEENEEETTVTAPGTSLMQSLQSFVPRFNVHKFAGQDLTHSRKIFLSIAVIIVVILFASIMFAVKKQEDAKAQALFSDIFPQAQKKYDEGQGLADLNRQLAKEDFEASQKILQDNKSKFKDGSEQRKQVDELLGKATKALTSVSGEKTIQPAPVDEKSSAFLLIVAKNLSALAFAQDDKSVYVIDKSVVAKIAKDTEKKQAIIQNKNYWESSQGLGTYFGNVYVLDKRGNQVIKFVPSEDGFVKTSYFGAASPNVSKAISLAIDGSIYLLYEDGSINKFTKGVKDAFSVKGLDMPVSPSSELFTNADTDSLYILDRENKRIVKLGKDGSYQSLYKTDMLKTTKYFEVLEKDKKIYILAQSRIYEIPLQ